MSRHYARVGGPRVRKNRASCTQSRMEDNRKQENTLLLQQWSLQIRKPFPTLASECKTNYDSSGSTPSQCRNIISFHFLQIDPIRVLVVFLPMSWPPTKTTTSLKSCASKLRILLSMSVGPTTGRRIGRLSS